MWLTVFYLSGGCNRQVQWLKMRRLNPTVMNGTREKIRCSSSKERLQPWVLHSLCAQPLCVCTNCKCHISELSSQIAKARGVCHMFGTQRCIYICSTDTNLTSITHKMFELWTVNKALIIMLLIYLLLFFSVSVWYAWTTCEECSVRQGAWISIGFKHPDLRWRFSGHHLLNTGYRYP